MATCCAYRVTRDQKGYYLISGSRCDANAIWTVYYSRNLGVYLFLDSIRTPARTRGFQSEGYKRQDVLVDSNGNYHYYENHSDLVPLRLCYYHLKMLKGFLRPSEVCGWFYPSSNSDLAKIFSTMSQDLSYFGQYGQVVIAGKNTAKTNFTVRVVPAARTVAQRDYHCCSMTEKSVAKSDSDRSSVDTAGYGLV